MLLRNPIWRFALTFCVLYALLAMPWPGVQETYSSLYRRAANALFDPFGKRGVDASGNSVKLGRVSFEEAGQPSRTSDTIISTKLRGSRYIGDSEHSPRLSGYLPTVEFIALALATPIAWRRKLVGLAVGTALVQLFVALRMWIALTYWFSTPETPWRMYEWRPLVWKTLSLAHEAINVAPVASFAVPALLWLMLLFRPTDWSDALGALMPEQDAGDNVTEESGRSGSTR